MYCIWQDPSTQEKACGYCQGKKLTCLVNGILMSKKGLGKGRSVAFEEVWITVESESYDTESKDEVLGAVL